MNEQTEKRYRSRGGKPKRWNAVPDGGLLGFYGCNGRVVCVGGPKGMTSKHLLSQARVRYRIPCPACGNEHLVLPQWRQATRAEIRRKAEITLRKTQRVLRTAAKRRTATDHSF